MSSKDPSRSRLDTAWRIAQPFVVVGLVTWVLGCTNLVEDIATRLSEKELSRVEHDLQVLHAEVQAFRDCVEGSGGSCPGAAFPATAAAGKTPTPGTDGPRPLTTQVPESVKRSIAQIDPSQPSRQGLDAAVATLEHPVQGQLNDMYNQLRGSSGAAAADSGTATVHLRVKDLQSYADTLYQATSAGGWQTLAQHAHQHHAMLQAQGAPDDQIAAAARHSRTTEYIRRYVEAYFENGRFFQVEVDVNDLEAKAERYLDQRLPLLCGGGSGGGAGGSGSGTAGTGGPSGGDPSAGSGTRPVTCDDLVAAFKSELFKGVTTTPEGSYLFTKIGQVGFVSRVGDQYAFPGITAEVDPAGQHPFTASHVDHLQVANQLLQVILMAIFDAHEGLPAVSNATGADSKELGGDALPVFSPSQAMTSADFQSVATYFRQTDATTGAVLGRAIRGVGPFSLNNEALADLFTTAISVTVAKASEKAAWCWYSCGLAAEIDLGRQQAEAKAKSEVRKVAHKVKVKLSL